LIVDGGAGVGDREVPKQCLDIVRLVATNERRWICGLEFEVTELVEELGGEIGQFRETLVLE
jgi:hypothetical protein